MPRAAVIHGADNPKKAAFKLQVETLQAALNTRYPGANWQLKPIYWGSRTPVDAIVAGLPYAYPPEPKWWDRLSIGSPPRRLSRRRSTITIGEIEAAAQTQNWPVVAWAIWQVRQFGLPKLAGTAADALLYGNDHERIRADVTEQIKVVFPAGPANVIAHSGGAMIAVDLAAKGDLAIDGLVTFSSISSVLHILAPGRLDKLPPFEPPTKVNPKAKVPLPRIDRWTNLYSIHDFAAFAASGVFELASGKRIHDREAQLPGDAKLKDAHDAYWKSEDLLEAIRKTCQ